MVYVSFDIKLTNGFFPLLQLLIPCKFRDILYDSPHIQLAKKSIHIPPCGFFIHLKFLKYLLYDILKVCCCIYLFPYKCDRLCQPIYYFLKRVYFCLSQNFILLQNTFDR